MSPREILEAQLTLCERLHEQLQEENRVLLTGQLPPDDLLTRKQALLPELTARLEELKALAATPLEKDPELRKLKENLQRRMMSTILLDKENENLLRKLAGGQRKVVRHSSAHEVQKAYERLMKRG